MTEQEQQAKVPEDAVPNPQEQGREADGLFGGDQGTLAADVRRVLTLLIRDPYVCALTSKQDYETIRLNLPVLESSLNDLGLELVVSTRYEVAYARQLQTDGGPLMLKKAQPLRRDATCLLVSIRARQHNDEANGEERWLVSRDDLAQLLTSGPYAGELDGQRVERALSSAIGQLTDAGYLQAMPAAPDRYQVMPILPAVFTLDRAKELLAALADQDGGGMEGSAS